MNCPECKTSIDYRFSTNCPHCQAELLCLNTVEETSERNAPLEGKKRNLSIRQYVRNAVLMVVSSLLCTVGGAVLTYLLAGVFYRTFLYQPEGPHDCGRGMAFAMLSILAGGFLGCTWGTVLGYKNGIWSGASSASSASS